MATSTETQGFAAVQRACQLDALRLDDELLSLFLTSLRDCLRFFPQSTLETYLPELKALLRLFFHANTVLIQKPSPGNAFQNLRYQPLSTAQRALHLILDVLFPYLFATLRRRLSSSERSLRGASRRHQLARALNGLEAAGRLCNAVNLALFFSAGTFRSLADRAVGARLSYARRAVARAPAFEFVNAQLVWQGVAEFALLLAPLLTNPSWLGRFRVGRRLLVGLGVADRVLHTPAHGAGVSKCALCGAADVVMKHQALPCRHVFCYVCVATERERDPAMKCGVCGAGVHDIERVQFGT